MVDKLWVMYVSVVVSVGIMLFASEPVSKFVNNHPAFKMLALSFLLLIGVSLIGEGLSFHILKGYIYFAMAFALLVDIFQMKMSKPKGVYDACYSVLKSDGYKVINERLPFPGSGQQRVFREKFKRALQMCD